MATNSKQESKNAKASAKVRAAQQQKRQRLQWSIGIVVLVVVGVVVLVLAKASTSDKAGTDGNSADLVAKPAPASIATDLAAVPLPAIAAAASIPSSNPVKPNPDGKPMKVDGKPEVLFIGAEFCPYCAGERWSLVSALSKFGTFSDLQVIHSAESNVPTMTFVGSKYTSKYVAFTPVEMNGNTKKGGNWVPLETPTASQQELFSTLGGNSFPFIDFGGTAYQSAGSVDVANLVGKTQTDIASTLAGSTKNDTDPTSLRGNVNSVTAEFIRTICGLTDNQPANVCKAIPAA